MFRTIFICALFALMFVACGNKNNKLVVTGNEKERVILGDTSEIKEKKYVSSFKSVDISCASTVDIKIGHEYSVIIDGQKAYVDAQRVVSDNGILKLSFDSDYPVKKSTHVVITTPYLDGLKLSGCGMVTVHGNDINVKTFSLDVDKINVVKINSKIISHRIDATINNSMFTSIMTDCDELFLNTNKVSHVQILGKVKHYRYIGGEKRNIGMRKT